MKNLFHLQHTGLERNHHRPKTHDYNCTAGCQHSPQGHTSSTHRNRQGTSPALRLMAIPRNWWMMHPKLQGFCLLLLASKYSSISDCSHTPKDCRTDFWHGRKKNTLKKKNSIKFGSKDDNIVSSLLIHHS